MREICFWPRKSDIFRLITVADEISVSESAPSALPPHVVEETSVSDEHIKLKEIELGVVSVKEAKTVEEQETVSSTAETTSHDTSEAAAVPLPKSESSSPVPQSPRSEPEVVSVVVFLNLDVFLKKRLCLFIVVITLE